ncbi:MAG TPA: cation:proton antiporter [Thermomicrobiales bacterium]|nr:cation:proton antiporter [Thermomicrobiales bacterium]
MIEATFEGLLWLALAAALAPIIVDIIPKVPVPVVVVEIALGILFGPYLLDVIEHSTGLEIAKEFGVIFLFFLAGFEVDFEGIKGEPLKNALTGWVGSIIIALAIAFTLQQLDLISSFHLFAIAIATTALGPLMPILQDSGQIHTKFGSNALSIGAVGEFLPVLAVAFLFNDTRESQITALVLIAFFAIVGVLLYGFRRGVGQKEDSQTRRIIVDTLNSSAQFAVRLSILILVVLVYLTARFDLDVLLGAFAGGFIIGQLGDVASTSESRKVMEWLKVKLESIGFGVFIPAFFVMTGADLQLDTLFSSNRALVIMVLTIAAFLLIRGLPVLGLYRSLDGGMRFRLALIASTQLPLVATLMNRLVESGDVPEDIATAVIAGSVLTVALFPIIAFIGVEDEEEPLIWGAIRRRVKPAVEALPAIEAREENDE